MQHVVKNLFAENTSGDPLRLPDWRHRQADELVRSGRPVIGARLDAQTRQLVDYLRVVRQTGCPVVSRRRCMSLGVVHQAVSLNKRELATGSVIIKARLLAGQTPVQIGERAGVPAAAVGLFHELYFDVRSRLQHVDLIIRDIIYVAQKGGMPSAQTTATLLVGYFGGPQALDEYLALPSAAKTRDLAQLMQNLGASTTAHVDLQTFLAVCGRGEHAAGPSSFVSYAMRRAAERPAETPLNRYEQQMQALLNDIPFTSGNDAVQHAPEQLKPFLTSAAELRDDELLAVMAGDKAEGIDQLTTLELRPPRQNKHLEKGGVMP